MATHMEHGETSVPTTLMVFSESSSPANPPHCDTRTIYLKISIVVIRMFGFTHLDCHSGLLHELARRQRHRSQHVLTAPMQHFL